MPWHQQSVRQCPGPARGRCGPSPGRGVGDRRRQRCRQIHPDEEILSGVHQPDRGAITIAGQPTRIADPHQARELGIATVFQNLALVDQRDVAANLFLGREPVRGGIFVDRKAMVEGARKVFADLKVHIPSLGAEVGQLSGGQRQSIAIGRAAAQQGRVIIMDEPTAALGVQESQKVPGPCYPPESGRHLRRHRQPQSAPRLFRGRPDHGAAARPPRR